MQNESKTTDCKQVYQYVASKIFTGEFPPGYKLVEKDIAEACSVSRTPVRLAIERFISEGLAFREPNCSAKVRKVAIEDIVGLLSIRAVNEGLAARLACQNINPGHTKNLTTIYNKIEKAKEKNDTKQYSILASEVHDYIIGMAKNDYLRNIIEKIYSITHRYHIGIMMQPGRIDESFEEHKQIIKFLLAGRGEEAEKAMINHIMNIVGVFQDESNLITLRSFSAIDWK